MYVCIYNNYIFDQFSDLNAALVVKLHATESGMMSNDVIMLGLSDVVL